MSISEDKMIVFIFLIYGKMQVLTINTKLIIIIDLIS